MAKAARRWRGERYAGQTHPAYRNSRPVRAQRAVDGAWRNVIKEGRDEQNRKLYDPWLQGQPI